jgi:hypothetical protein
MCSAATAAFGGAALVHSIGVAVVTYAGGAGLRIHLLYEGRE